MPILSIEAKQIGDVMFHLRKYGMAFDFNKQKYPRPKDLLCQVKVKFAKWFFFRKTESVLHLVLFQFLFICAVVSRKMWKITDESVNGQKDKR